MQSSAAALAGGAATRLAAPATALAQQANVASGAATGAAAKAGSLPVVVSSANDCHY